MERPEEQAVPVLRFAKELCSESSNLGKYLQWIENTMQTGDVMEKQSAYTGKAGGKLIRIAGLLHLLWDMTSARRSLPKPQTVPCRYVNSFR